MSERDLARRAVKLNLSGTASEVIEFLAQVHSELASLGIKIETSPIVQLMTYKLKNLVISSPDTSYARCQGIVTHMAQIEEGHVSNFPKAVAESTKQNRAARRVSGPTAWCGA